MELPMVCVIWRTSGAVSYTHLDVYKRQEISPEDVDQALENLNQALALLEKKDDGEDDTTVYKLSLIHI